MAAAAYLFGVLLFLGHMLWQHLGLRRTLRRALEPSRELALLFEQMCRGFGMRDCQLRIMPQLSSPATAGWRHPVILLPEVCEEFNDSSQLGDVLYHELVHVLRRDYLWAAVSDLVRCVLFFHPAVWRARQHMRVERELACDIAVVSGRPEHRADYAQSLTRFARLRMLQPGRFAGIDFAASASLLGMRVRAVLSQRAQSSWWQTGVRSALSLTLLVSLGVLWPLFGVAATFMPEELLAAPRLAPVALAMQPHPASVSAQAHGRAPARSRRTVIVAPRIASQAPLLVLPPVASEPRPPAMVAMSSSEFGPQSNDFDPSARGPVDDGGQPNWSETRPVTHSHISVAVVVQRVATGLAQAAREQIGRGGHDRPGHWR